MLEHYSMNTEGKESRILDPEQVSGDMINIKHLGSWDVGGRKFVLNVSLNWHTKIQGQISNHRFSQLFKE